jgi:hypothetical protein
MILTFKGVIGLNFRRYSIGDEKHILNVFERAFGRELSFDYWKWRYIDNPIKDTTLINLAWDENKLAAHYALSPTALFINGIKYCAALSMTTFTDPNYLRRGLFTKLAQELYSNNKSSLDVVFGVPNDNSVSGFTNKLGFNLIKEIPMLESKISNVKINVCRKCEIVEKFDKRFDELFLNVINKYKIITSRDSKYLNWRFVENPHNKYQIIAYIEEEKVLGYAVIKTYNSGMIGDIVDLIALNDSVLRHLLNFSFNLFQSKNILSVNTWFCDNENMNTLKEFNFQESGQYFHFIVKNNSEVLNENLFNFNNWYITMSDIDIF